MSWGVKEEEEGKIANICQVPIKCLAQNIPHLFDFPVLTQYLPTASLLNLVTIWLLYSLVLGCHNNPSHASGLPQWLSYSLKKKPVRKGNNCMISFVCGI